MEEINKIGNLVHSISTNSKDDSLTTASLHNAKSIPKVHIKLRKTKKNLQNKSLKQELLLNQ